MKCYVVMAMLLAIGLDVSEGKPGDCAFSKTADMVVCVFLCGFTSAWSTCDNNVCCCGFANKWTALRYSEGEVCSGDVVTTPQPVRPCVGSECQEKCGSIEYLCQDACCMCATHPVNDRPAWEMKYCGGLHLYNE